MATLPNGLGTAERGSTVWRLIYNENFSILDDTLGDLSNNYYTKTQSDNRYYTKTDADAKYATKTDFYRTKTALGTANSWENYGSPYEPLRWTRDEYSLVHVQGVVKSGSTGTVIASLPSSASPDYTRIFPVVTGSNTLGVIEVSTSGDIKLLSGDTSKVAIELTFRK
jgi:hypothetical protein